MPKLIKPELVEALRKKVAAMQGTPTQIAAALNAPEVTGYETGTVEAADAYEALSPDTLLALDTAAGGTDALAGEALWLLSALADVDPLSLAEGSAGAEALEVLRAGGVVPQAEAEALIAAAQVEVLGPSWGRQAGIGYVEARFILEVQV